MVFVKISESTIFQQQRSSLAEIIQDLESVLHISKDSFYITRNGRLCQDQGLLLGLDDVIQVNPRLVGGKGGFGSMLRALGSQISKTNNKEACRDLSGRRLRDINDEDRLKKYVAKQAEREREAEEKHKAKMAKLKRLANDEAKHEFVDPKYMKEREEATERVHDAVEAAFKAAAEEPKPSTSGVKRKSDNEASSSKQPEAKKGLWMGVDLNDSDLDSSSDEEEEEVKKPVQKSAVAASS